MRWMAIGMLVWCVANAAQAGESALVEKYLYSGDLARGEQVIETALDDAPKDDQLRLSLGFLQIARGVERLGQSLYGFGLSENNVPLLRLPLPKNPDPTPITYAEFRRVLDLFRDDLATAERTLSGITDDKVKLRLRLANIRLDLDGDKRAEITLSEIVSKLMGSRFRAPANNPDFQVAIDRGDVAWLRAYCHVLMSLVEAQGAFDGEMVFYSTTARFFATPKPPKAAKPDDGGPDDFGSSVPINDPVRLGRFRKHLIAVCDLNHETWRYIRAERDDDYEWLPNSKQKGILGLPISDDMVDAWLGMIDEVKDLMEGKKVISPALVSLISPNSGNKRGLSIKLLLDNPPDKIEWSKIHNEGIDPKYLVADHPELNLAALFRVGQVFQNSMAVGYAMYFN